MDESICNDVDNMHSPRITPWAICVMLYHRLNEVLYYFNKQKFANPFYSTIITINCNRTHDH